ncbi:MAG: hypothetical protein NTX93_02895 [Bacteroidia bacterium]|nr:hypothetical protein [Bacteroidia bacterium]
MKKLLVFVVLSGWALLGLAQDQKSSTLERKNVVKFLPINLPFQSISFEYERMINAKNSFTLGVGLPNQKSLIGKYGIKDDKKLKTAELGTMHIRVAYRHYFGKRMLPKGLYIEPYLKYQDIKGKASIEGKDGQNVPYKGDINVKLNTMNLGFQSGAQFLIAKRVSLDFYFSGLEVGLLSGNVTATSDQIADADNIKANIDDAIADLPSFIGDKLTVTQPSGTKVNIKASSVPYPWLRCGISIGIAF